MPKNSAYRPGRSQASMDHMLTPYGGGQNTWDNADAKKEEAKDVELRAQDSGE